MPVVGAPFVYGGPALLLAGLDQCSRRPGRRWRRSVLPSVAGLVAVRCPVAIPRWAAAGARRTSPSPAWLAPDPGTSADRRPCAARSACLVVARRPRSPAGGRFLALATSSLLLAARALPARPVEHGLLPPPAGARARRLGDFTSARPPVIALAVDRRHLADVQTLGELRSGLAPMLDVPRPVRCRARALLARSCSRSPPGRRKSWFRRTRWPELGDPRDRLRRCFGRRRPLRGFFGSALCVGPPAACSSLRALPARPHQVARSTTCSRRTSSLFTGPSPMPRRITPHELDVYLERYAQELDDRPHRPARARHLAHRAAGDAPSGPIVEGD